VASLLADEFREIFIGFSIGSNDIAMSARRNHPEDILRAMMSWAAECYELLNLSAFMIFKLSAFLCRMPIAGGRSP
jgi:hypothetical protein